MIEIKSRFGEWREVTPDEARKFCADIIRRTGFRSRKYWRRILEKHLRGISVDELFSMRMGE